MAANPEPLPPKEASSSAKRRAERASQQKRKRQHRDAKRIKRRSSSSSSQRATRLLMLMTVASLVPMKASLVPLARAPPPRCLLADEDMLRYAFMLPTATGVATLSTRRIVGAALSRQSFY